MSTPRSFIIVKGQPKALLIEKMELGEHGVYAIKYKNSQNTYHYRYGDVVVLSGIGNSIMFQMSVHSVKET